MVLGAEGHCGKQWQHGLWCHGASWFGIGLFYYQWFQNEDEDAVESVLACYGYRNKEAQIE